MSVELVRTVRVQIRITPEQSARLDALRPLVTAAYNDACAYAWEHDVKGAVDLHHAIYKTLCAKYGLKSQFVCNVQRLAMGSIASARARLAKNEPVSCPNAERLPIPYDGRTMSLRPDRKSVTLATLGDRIELGVVGHKHLRRYAEWAVDSGRVLKDDCGRWCLLLTFTRDVTTPKPLIAQVVGCDRGIVVPAALSTGQLLGDPNAHHVDRRYFRTQRQLTRKGTKSAKRRLKRRAEKWSRFRAWSDHNITRQIVNVLPAGTTLVLEDLTNIRVRARRVNRRTRRRMHAWSFRRQQEMLAYKAPERGIAVVFVDAHYTSQKCNQCKYVSRKNRTRQRFVCIKCGHVDHADLNASKNIGENWVASQANDNPPVVSRKRRVSPPHAAHAKDPRSQKTGTALSGSGAAKRLRHRDLKSSGL